MTQLKITVDAARAQAMIDRALSQATHTEPMMNSIAVELLSLTEEAFASEGSPNQWQSLASATIHNREKKGQWPGKVLQVSGALAASIQPFHNNNEAGLSSNKPYAAIHQFGGQAGRDRKVTIPARPFMPLDGNKINEEATHAILEIVMAHFSQN